MVRKLTSAGMYGLAVVWLFPLLWVVWTSVRPRELATSWTFSADFTLANFAKVWDAAPFAQYYFNTFLIVAGVLVAQIVTATLAAYAFAKLRFWGRDVLFVLFLVQLMVLSRHFDFPELQRASRPVLARHEDRDHAAVLCFRLWRVSFAANVQDDPPRAGGSCAHGGLLLAANFMAGVRSFGEADIHRVRSGVSQLPLEQFHVAADYYELGGESSAHGRAGYFCPVV